MGQYDVGLAETGTQSDVFTNYSVDEKQTDSSSGQKETEWINTNCGKYLGYYKTIPELKIAIDTKGAWTIGKGFSCPFEKGEITELSLSTLKGIGTDTFNSIIENMIRCYNIYGDAYAEIIRDENKKLVNLKVLDPSTIKIISNKKGIIIRYDQITKSGETIKFNTKNIFHLSRSRVADEIHGISLIESVEWIILARNEAMSDYKKLLHRNLYPLRVWHLSTDNKAKVAAFKAKVAEAKYKGEDIFIPKESVATELAVVPTNATLDPKAWIQILNNYFYQAVGVPQIIIGGSQELTQTAAQIAYLAFEQVIEEEQLYIEEQVLSQLNLEINLEFPASLQNSLLTSQVNPEERGNTQGINSFQQFRQPSKFQPPMMRQNK